MFSHPSSNRLILLLGVTCLLALFSDAFGAEDSKQLLDKASKQIEDRDYISAKETLEQVKPAELTPADRQRLGYLVSKADYGLDKASQIRQKITEAQKLAKENYFVLARQLLEEAFKSAGQDPAAQSKIKTALAEVNLRFRQVAGDMKTLFAKSKEDYAAGRLDQAEQGFKTVIQSGVDLGFWNRGAPQKYLNKIALEKARRGPLPIARPAPIQPAETNTTIVVKPAPEQNETVETVFVPAESKQARRYPTATSPEQGTLIAEEVKRRRIITQQITMQHKVALDQAEDLVKEHKFSEARRVVRQAQGILRTHQSVIPVMAGAMMHTAGETKLAFIEQEERAYQAAQVEDERIRAETASYKAMQRVDQQRQDRVKDLFAQGATFIQERKYDLALDRYRQVLSIDPNDDAARKLASWLQDQVYLLRAQDVDAEKQTEFQGVIEQTRKASIPYDRDPPLTWDPNWLEISKRRLWAQDGIAEDSPENMEARRRLSTVYPQFAYEDIALSEVFEDLRAKSDLNIVPNWPSLTEAGIEKDRTISLQLKNVSLERALKAVLADLSAASYYGTISSVLQEGVVVIATAEALGAELSSIVYEVSDLLIENTEMRGGGQFGGGGSSDRSGSNRDRGGSGSNRDRGSSSSNRDRGSSNRGRNQQSGGSSGNNNYNIREDLLDDILDLVMLIDPDSWEEVGEGKGTASIFNGKLVIWQTAEVHSKIRDMLKQIRDTRPVQISVETRFLFVTDNFLEDIGVDLDFFLSPQGHWVGPDTRAIGAAGHPGFRTGTPAPLPFYQGGSSWAAPSGTGLPGSLGGASAPSAITIAGSFLDKLEVDFLIRATQASRKATTLAAPRVTFENAGSASIFVGRDTTYVSNVVVETSENAVGYEIETDTIESGPTLNVGGVVSPDRRFVRLNIEVALNDLVGLDFISDLVPAAAALTPELSLTQIPVMDTSEIATQVSVPDGAALLIGGLRRSAEAKKEIGVPILSKLPYINRWFTNKSFVTDKFVLVILLRPRIIDLKEEQGRNYPVIGER